MPEFRPLFSVRKGGSALRRVSTRRGRRRSEKPARTAIPRATWSRAIASACAWKFPPLTLVPSGKMSGLSVAAFISIRRDATALSSVARTAPRTCGMHRSVYGSCTLCGPLWDGIISLARRRRRRFAATSLAPGCGFSPTRRSSNGFGDPRSASKDIEAATWASFSNRRPSFTKMAPTAAITDVPLMIARPSLDWRTRGARFAFARALSPGRTCPPTSASPSPMSTRPRCARGARSPLAPSEPRDGITGWTPRFKKSRRRDTRIRRTPEYPIASVFARRRRAARTSSRRSGGPRPIAWLRNRLSCSARTSASEMATFASSPKPVLIPYAREPLATTVSRARRLVSTRFAAAGARRTGSPWRATAITSSRSSDRPSIERLVGELLSLGYFTPGFPVKAKELPPGGTVDCGEYAITAHEAVHTVPCLSYVLEEKPRPGRFSVERAESLGVPTGPLYSRLQEGETIRIGDRTIRPEDVLGPPRRGRKIVYTGDTMPHEDLVQVARRADVLIHDATSDAALEEKANRHGHSSSRQAAQVAKESAVGLLVLTHLSPRYEDPTTILEDARKVFPSARVAEDFLEIEVPYPD